MDVSGADQLGALMRRAQAGDKNAYRSLLKAIEPLITSFVRSRLRDSVLSAEDVCQDVLLRVHAFRDTYDPERPFRPWMYAIAKHTLIDAIRGRKRQISTTELTEIISDQVGESSSSEAIIDFGQAMSGLSDAAKTDLILAKVEGKSISEIAAVTNSSPSAVKVRIHRAMQQIRQKVMGSSE